jgi:hypothetical protein
MGIRKWFRAFWYDKQPDGRPRQEGLPLPSRPMVRPEETFAIQTLYARHGQQIYARAAADPSFSTAIAAEVSHLRTVLQENPMPAPSRQVTESYLLGLAHGTLMGLLDVSLTSDSNMDGIREAVAVRLGAMFQLGFDEGLLQLTAGRD